MQFLVSTTGTDVLLKDLGVFIQHPTVDRDIALEFSHLEISQSNDMESAILGGFLSLKISKPDGSVDNFASDEYDKSLVLQADITIVPENITTTQELGATLRSTPIQLNTFPISLSSTTAVTNVVVANSGKFFDWRVSKGDAVYISGTGTIDGYYTVSYVVDQRKLVTVEALSTTNSVGYITILYPPGSVKIGVDDTSFTTVSGSNLQLVLKDIDTVIGSFTASELTTDNHKTLRQLIHFIDEGPAEGFLSGAYRETLPSADPFPTTIIWWESSAKAKKIVETDIAYGQGKVKPTPIIWKVYDVDGTTVLATITDAITYSGVFETSRTRTIA